MKDKLSKINSAVFGLILIMAVLLIVNAVLAFMNFSKIEVTEVINVLPVNEDKELVEPDEVRQYVLEMARREKVNVAMVEKIGYCESRWRWNAVSKSGTYVGIFQIGKIHGLGDDRLDVVKSTKWSLDKMKREGYGAWSCSVI